MKHHNPQVKRLVNLLGTFAFSLVATAQMYVNKEWVETTGLPDNLEWTASTFDALGNVIVVGNTLVAPGNPDVLITKYDREGVLLWQQTYGGTAGAQDYGVAVVADGVGNVFVAAAATNTSTALDIVVLNYDANGTLIWSTPWNGPTNLMDAPSCIALDPSGNVYAAGSTFNTLTNPDYAIVKLNAGGALQWSATYDYAGFADVATGIEFDLLNDPVVTGGSANAVNAWDYATVRYNKVSGNQSGVNRVSIPGVGLDNALAFTRDNAGSLFITGYRETAGNKDIQTVKLNSTFGLAWVQNYTGQGLEDIGKAIGGDNLGNVYVTGHTRKTNGGSDFITIKYGPTGTVLWEQHYQARNDTWIAEANKLAVTNDGGVIVTGTIFDGTSRNFMTVKYSADGKLEWEKEYDGLNGDDKSLDLLADGNGNVYVSGLKSTGGGAEYATVKYTYLKKDNGNVYDGNGDPYCVDNELIVKFRPDVVNPAVVDDQGWEYGDLDKVIGTALTAQIEAALGLATGGKRLQAFKIFRRLTTAEQYSTTRLGEQEPMYEHWSTFLVTIPDPLDLVVSQGNLSTLPDVIEYAEPNHLYKQHALPNDTYLNQQESLVPNFGSLNANINCEPAWDVQTGRDYIKVGVVDAPIYWTHEDFGDGTYNGSKIEGGWDFSSNVHISNNANPLNSHGTGCAGIIGALRNNGTGVAGIAGGDVDGVGNSGVALISLGIFNDAGTAVAANVIAGAIVEGSTDFNGSYGYGCDVLNNSYGGGAYNITTSNAVRTCWRNKCVFVASRGNDGVSSVQYPVGYGGDPWVLSVGASGTDGGYKNTTNGDNWWSSNYGNNVDVVAPGTTQIITTTENPNAPIGLCPPLSSGYECFNGTSAAAPHVAGVAALMMSEHHVNNGAPNNLACEDVEGLMQRFATDISGAYSGGFNYGAGYDDYNGWGRANAGAALQGIDRPFYTVFHSSTPNSTQQTTFANQNVIIQNNAGGLANGWYNADRVQVIHTYLNVFSPTTQIIDRWERSSSAVGYSAANPIDGSTWGNYSFSIVSNVASVSVITNCWHVNYTSGGSTVNQWIPAPPGSLTTAYSLYMYDPSAVGVEEAALPDEALVLFPTPAEEVLNILLNLDGNDLLPMEVIDVAGRVVFKEQVRAGRGVLHQIPVENLSQGTYALRLGSSNASLVKRFIKR